MDAEESEHHPPSYGARDFPCWPHPPAPLDAGAKLAETIWRETHPLVVHVDSPRPREVADEISRSVNAQGGRTDEDLLRWVVSQAGRYGHRAPRWVHVRDLLGMGSTSAAEMCRRFGLDPDEEVPPRRPRGDQ